MSGIPLVDPAAAVPQSREILDAFKAKVGMVPNLLKALAHSPAALQFYTSGSDVLSHASLSAGLREKLAIAIAEANSCHYCLSAHTAIGKMVGVAGDELAAARTARSSDAKDAAALAFAQTVVQRQGRVTDDDLKAVRAAGLGDAQIAEIVAVVAINIFTNYFNHIADTPIDFPRLKAGH